MRFSAKILLLVLLASLVASARKRDPLTEAETDQLREVAMLPYKRLKLLIKFTDARLVAIDQVRVDPKLAQDRGKQIHDLLEDFTALMDEINDNLDQYEARQLSQDDRKDFKKGLKELIEADERFDLKLRTLQSAAESDPQTRKELPDFRFALQDAQEALKSNAEVAREDMATSKEEKKK